MQMTPKQLNFVDEYLVDFNASRAAVMAGFSPHTAKVQGSRLLTNVNVKALVMQRQNEASQRLQVTRDDVVSALMAVAEKACDDKQPMVAIAAMKEVSKMLGFYPQRASKSGHANESVRQNRLIEEMSDQELLDLVKRDTKANLF